MTEAPADEGRRRNLPRIEPTNPKVKEVFDKVVNLPKDTPLGTYREFMTELFELEAAASDLSAEDSRAVFFALERCAAFNPNVCMMPYLDFRLTKLAAARAAENAADVTRHLFGLQVRIVVNAIVADGVEDEARKALRAAATARLADVVVSSLNDEFIVRDEKAKVEAVNIVHAYSRKAGTDDFLVHLARLIKAEIAALPPQEGEQQGAAAASVETIFSQCKAAAVIKAVIDDKRNNVGRRFFFAGLASLLEGTPLEATVKQNLRSEGRSGRDGGEDERENKRDRAEGSGVPRTAAATVDKIPAPFTAVYEPFKAKLVQLQSEGTGDALPLGDIADVARKLAVVCNGNRSDGGIFLAPLWAAYVHLIQPLVIDNVALIRQRRDDAVASGNKEALAAANDAISALLEALHAGIRMLCNMRSDELMTFHANTRSLADLAGFEKLSGEGVPPEKLLDVIPSHVDLWLRIVERAQFLNMRQEAESYKTLMQNAANNLNAVLDIVDDGLPVAPTVIERIKDTVQLTDRLATLIERYASHIATHNKNHQRSDERRVDGGDRRGGGSGHRRGNGSGGRPQRGRRGGGRDRR